MSADAMKGEFWWGVECAVSVLCCAQSLCESSAPNQTARVTGYLIIHALDRRLDQKLKQSRQWPSSYYGRLHIVIQMKHNVEGDKMHQFNYTMFQVVARSGGDTITIPLYCSAIPS